MPKPIINASSWPHPGALPERARALCTALGVDLGAAAGVGIAGRTPITGETLATLRAHTRG